MAQPFLNVADIRLHSRVNGPGLRSVVWVQGCTIRCPGCANPNTHPHEARHLFEPEALGRLLSGIAGTDGITITGGEPFEQAEVCSMLAGTARAAGKSVVVFTGYPYEYLRRSRVRAVGQFLARIDLLIAGPYVASLRTDGALWRASSNQTVHALTPRLQSVLATPAIRELLVEIAADGKTFTLTGFPEIQDRSWIEELVSTLRCSSACSVARTRSEAANDDPRWASRPRTVNHAI